VPMLAAGLADVLVANPDPAVIGRVGDHPLDQLTVDLLGVGAPGDLRPGLGEAMGERVPGPLELGHPEDPGSTGSADGPLDAEARKGRGEELAELALHAGDLTTQLDSPGAPVLDEAAVALWARPPTEAERLVPCIRIQLKKRGHAAPFSIAQPAY